MPSNNGASASSDPGKRLAIVRLTFSRHASIACCSLGDASRGDGAMGKFSRVKDLAVVLYNATYRKKSSFSVYILWKFILLRLGKLEIFCRNLSVSRKSDLFDLGLRLFQLALAQLFERHAAFIRIDGRLKVRTARF